MRSNTEHHLKYVQRLLEDLHDEGKQCPRVGIRLDKLQYCLSKIRFNVKSGRAKSEHVESVLNTLRDQYAGTWVEDAMALVTRKVIEAEAERSAGVAELLAS